jgi:hypothetical protein
MNTIPPLSKPLYNIIMRQVAVGIRNDTALYKTKRNSKLSKI